tara:strand:+ start:120 stop:701 length:582 start_codon:yes stop_codon:yes gene_type:complete
MDDEKNNLAGKLSKPKNLPHNTFYIGAQSRFKHKIYKNKYDFLAIVSGPEPQRTILEMNLIKSLSNRDEKSLIVLGRPEQNIKKKIGNLTISSHLNSNDLCKVICQSELIICRPGYSTVMDLSKLGKKAFFIPTPGQTEQEYLATRFLKNKICFFQKQNKFNFDLAINESKNYSGFTRKERQETDWKKLFSLF